MQLCIDAANYCSGDTSIVTHKRYITNRLIYTPATKCNCDIASKCGHTPSNDDNLPYFTESEPTIGRLHNVVNKIFISDVIFFCGSDVYIKLYSNVVEQSACFSICVLYHEIFG